MKPTFLGLPFRYGSQGGAAVIDDADRHLRDRILTVLFTSPGERVNRPRFGVGLRRSVFAELDEFRAAALRFRVVEGLSRDIGPDVVVEDVRIVTDPQMGVLELVITYRRTVDQVRRSLEVAL